MPKAKSKKSKNVDFQKIKLKVGKRLTKGDNVTNLSFKTRQIQLTQTIRTGETSLPVTKRNLSIQDLLRQCEHHSVGARVNAISGIKELVLNNFAEFLIPSNIHGYGTIMKKISSMLIDNESDVRHAVINLFKLMFSKLKLECQKLNTDNLMSGNLFSHIHAYMCCAMNHLHEDVRLDSLVLFDALLEAFPNAMIQQTGDLLKNLIGMISSPISIGSKGDSLTQRLSMNPDSKLPVMKFRARVLLRIKLTLQVALLEVSNQSLGTAAEREAESWSRFFDGRKEGIKQNTLLVSQQAAHRFFWILKGTATDMQDYIIKESSLEEFINLSIPILLQCWKEARASNPNDSVTDNLLSSDALEVMSLVARVVELLFSLSAAGCTKSNQIPTSYLVEKYETQFTQDFMSYFPYSALIDNKVSKKKKGKGQKPTNSIPTQSSLATLNVCISHIMSFLCCDHELHKDRSWLNKIQHFIVKSFDASPSAEHTRILIKVLTNVFQNHSLIGYFSPSFEAAFQYYTICKVKLPHKQDLFNLMSFVSKHWNEWKSSHFMHNEEKVQDMRIEETLQKFLKGLPKLLLRIPKTHPADIEWLKEVLTCISFSLTSQGIFPVADEFNNSLVDILDPATGLLTIDNEDIQQKVVSLLALCKPLSLEQLKLLLMAIRRPISKPVLPHRKSCSLACRAVTCISLGIRRNIPLSCQVEFNQMTEAQKKSLTDYLKFMFSLLIGMSREELESLTAVKINYYVEKEQWDRHRDIVNIVCQELLNLNIPPSPQDGYTQAFTFISNIEQLWLHALKNYKNMHVMSAYSLFKFVNFSSLPHIKEKPSSQFYEDVASVVADVLVSFYLPNSGPERLNKEIAEQVKMEITSSLSSNPTLLPHVCNKLKESGFSNRSGEDWRSSCLQAKEFLLSVDDFKKRIVNENLFDSSIS